jgi:hypothetical protein
MYTDKHQIRLVIFWVLMLIAMVLHFNYHVSDIFYGIDVARPGANGKVPVAAFYTKSIFYHLPMLLILAMLYLKSQLFKWILLLVGGLYTCSHTMHLVEEITKYNGSVQSITQVNLLVLVLAISVMANVEAWKWLKNKL